MRITYHSCSSWNLHNKDGEKGKGEYKNPRALNNINVDWSKYEAIARIDPNLPYSILDHIYQCTYIKTKFYQFKTTSKSNNIQENLSTTFKTTYNIKPIHHIMRTQWKYEDELIHKIWPEICIYPLSLLNCWDPSRTHIWNETCTLLFSCIYYLSKLCFEKIGIILQSHTHLFWYTHTTHVR